MVQQLAPAETLTETYNYTLTDKDGDTSSAALTITISGTNDTPTLTAGSISADEDALEAGISVDALTSNLLTSAADVDDVDTTLVIGTVNGLAGNVGSAVSVSLSYTDADGTPQSQAVDLTVNADGSYSLSSFDLDDLPLGNNATASFTYQVEDDSGALSSEETASITISGTNDTPTLTAGSISADEDALEAGISVDASTSNLLTSAADVDDVDTTLVIGTVNGLAGNVGSAVSVSLSYTDADGAAQTQAVDLTVNADGSYSLSSFDLDDLPLGNDATASFTYQVEDDSGALSSEETANITISGTNDSPVIATNTGANFDEGSTGNIISTAMLSEGDVDDSGTGLSYTITTDVANGTLRLSGTVLGAGDTFTQDDIDNNRLTYDHDGGQTSSDSFAFDLADGGEDGAGIVSDAFNLSIGNVNDAPVNTLPGAQVVAEDTDLTISGLSVADDDDNLDMVQLDVGSGTLNVTLSGGASISAGAGGTGNLTLSGSLADINATLASLSYRGNADFNGSDILTIVSTDTDGANDTDTVAITVNQVNDTATFSGDTSGSGAEDGGPITGTLSVADTADGMTTPNFSVTTDGVNGTATIDATTGAWSYTPDADFNGTDSFVVSVTDDDGNVETLTIGLTVNQVNDIATFSGDTSGRGRGGWRGDVGGRATRRCRLQRRDSFSLDDAETQTIGLTVNQVTHRNPGRRGAEGGDHWDAIGRRHRRRHDHAELHGRRQRHGDDRCATTGAWSYTPDADFNGSDSFIVSVTDDDGNVETLTIGLTVNQVNDTATFSGDTSGTGAEDGGPITGALGVADTADGMTTPNFTVTTDGANGTATIDATTGAWSYTPNADFNGSDSFTVSVTDDDGNVETQTIGLTVNQVNDTATFSGDTSGTGAEDGGPITGALSVTDTADGMTAPNFTVTTDGANGTATIDPTTGAWSYTPNADFNGSDSFIVSVTDDDGNVETQAIGLTVNQVNDTATFSGDTSGTGAEDGGPITGTLSVADSADGMTTPNFSVTTDGYERHGDDRCDDRGLELHAGCRLQRQRQLHRLGHR